MRRERLEVLRSWAGRYGMALASVGAAALATAALSRELSHTGLLFFYAAVLGSAWLGGAWPALLATALSLVAVDVLFLSAQNLPDRLTVHGLALAVFAASGTLVARTVTLGRAALREAEVERGRALEARDRDRFLAQVSRELAAGGGLHAVLHRLAAQVVEEIADYAVVYTLDERGPLRRGAVAHADPARLPLVRQLLDHSALARPSRAAREAVSTGEPVVFPEMTPEELRAQGLGPEHRRVLERLGPRSVLVVPLVAQDSVVGALVLAYTDHSGRRYGERDLELARELAVHAALAIEKAVQYERAERAVGMRDEILAIVAHDLRNPLQVVSTLAEALALRAGAEEGEVVHRIRRSLGQADKLIQELLDVSRLESGRLAMDREALEVDSVVAEALETARIGAQERGVVVELDLREPCPPVFADRRRLLQILWNLLDNAVKHTPEGGRVELGAGPEDGRVRFTVSDQGPGIPAEDVPYLFERFWQARKARRGAGLGLAIVKGIIDAHDGHIRVMSVPGRGSTFQFEIPAAPPGEGTPLAAGRKHG